MTQFRASDTTFRKLLHSDIENVPLKSSSKPPSFPHRARSWAEIKLHDFPERLPPLAKAIWSREEEFRAWAEGGLSK